MKMPNGYGSVYKLPGNRRKPWTVRTTVSRNVGTDGLTHWKYKYIGYYATQGEALIALAHYNENPYDLDSNKLTFADVFNLWSAEHYPRVSQSNINGCNAAYKACQTLQCMKFSDIRKAHLQNVVDTCGKNYPTLKKIKILFTMMYKFALENEIVGKDYSMNVDIKQYSDKNPNKYDRSPFTRDEVSTLWNNVEADAYHSIPLMLIYSGVRISELLDLKKENVHLEERYFDVVKSKTKAGVRKVPIADKVYRLFEQWYTLNNSEYLLSTPNGEHLAYRNYYDSYWMPIMSSLGMVHTPHCTRYTCITLLTAAGVDERVVKKIVGHSGNSITENVYTHLDMETLLEAINKI
jgi:integrase